MDSKIHNSIKKKLGTAFLCGLAAITKQITRNNNNFFSSPPPTPSPAAITPRANALSELYLCFNSVCMRVTRLLYYYPLITGSSLGKWKKEQDKRILGHSRRLSHLAKDPEITWLKSSYLNSTVVGYLITGSAAMDIIILMRRRINGFKTCQR